MTPSCDRQQNRAVEEAPLGGSSAVKKSSVPNSLSRGSDGSSGSRMGAEEQVMSEHASNGDAGSSSKKRRKRMDARSYIKKFKTGIRPGASAAVVASPDRMGKENTSSGHVADNNNNAAILCEGSRLIEKSKGHSSHAAFKVSKSPISGLHETSDTRVDQCSTPLLEVQPHKPTDVQNIAAESSLPAKARDPHTGPARQNILSSLQSVPISTIHQEEVLPHKRTVVQDIAAESSLPAKDRDRHTGPARQNIVPSLQSVPISSIHHKEIKSTLGDAEPISVQKENSAPGHLQVARSDGTDGNPNICVACGLGSPGTFRSCDGKGCKSRYHMSCLDQYLSLGNWFCTSCTKKRLQSGLHHIVDGIESVWDVKEAEGMQTSKQYFVKYKNLAHVHNCWVPEGDISVMPGGPDLLSLFNKRNHTEKTIRKEWTKPHRLLRKRLLVPPRLAEDFFCSDDFLCSSGVSYCTLEWLVKWRGLGYDHATWELETLSCLCTPEADELKENYENRREAAKQSSIPQKTKVKQSSFQKLERLPDGCHPDFDNDHLYSINHLREYWHKSRGAVLVDDKEYVIKTVLFTMSVLPDVSQPFLILTTPGSLSLWEVQFNKLAPFINVVVYDGGKDELKLIRDLEFYESGSHCMLQVLLSHPDAILEDIEPIAHIGWEAVIVDYYQKSALQYLEQLKQFPTDFRMLLDNLPEYVKLQAFLNSGEQENGSYVDTAETLMMLKGNFKSHIAYERQADSSKILEHWVPAYVSQLQLQTYCSILLSNSSVLQSQMKSDKALYDIIMSLSKCCDDPYLVDESLRPPVNNHDQTDPTVTRVQACGKLLLLQKMLEAIRNKRLRVIILFQSGAPAGSSMGDTLETVVRHKFGPESYERVGFCGSFSKKAVALNKFNDKTKGRFVFLIETNACLPSIELSSVDAIIIYNSDWNPLTDQKALQRIKIESHLSYPSIFRLYTPLTMEEKWLVLAKQGMLIDKKDITHSVSHSFISWGASCLFTRLDELKHDNCASKNSERDNFMDKVVSEFLKKLATNVVGSTKLNCTCISEANMSGEKEEMCALDGDPSKFWLNLLDGKSPSWSYISEPPQSSHNILQNMEEPPKVPAEEEPNETRRKRRKVGEITGVEKRMSTPKNLHVQLKKELSKLITALQLPDDVRAMAEQLFEYFLKNHLVVTEPVSILHAIIISLCWHAASVLKYNINCGESIALAGKSLNCECNEELASFIYGRLRFPEEKNPNRAIETSINGQPVSVEDTQISWEETSTNLATNLRINHMLQNKEMDHGNLTSSGPQEVSSSAEHMIPEVQEPVQETHGECHVSNDELPNMIVEKRTELDNNLDNFTNGAPQVISSGAEQMISEVQEPIQEIHRESHLPNDELPNMTLEKRAELVDNNHDNFTNGAPQVVSSGADHMISEEQEPVQETHRECHLSKDDLPNMIVEKRMELIDNVFSLREKNILCKQQLEISGLDTYTQNNVIRLKEVCTLVLKHIRRSHIDEVTRSDKIKLTVQWFTMLMYAFLDHMSLQHNKLEALQSDRWLVERHLKENLHQVAKSGQLDQDFDRHIALPDSNFVMEEFIHFKEQSGEYHIVESSVSDNQQSLDDGLLMEIALVRNEVLSGAISTQAMENEPAATSVDSSEGPASEAVDFPGNCILSSDGMGVQRAGCSSSIIFTFQNAFILKDWSITRELGESSSGDCRNTGHVEAENIANPSMLLEGADSLVRGLNANNDTVDTDQVHLESPVSPATLPMSTEFETQTCQSSMHVEQSPEVQQSTSMQGQPAEKRACIVGPEAAMQDQPAEAERAGVELSGMVTPHAVQSPASMPAEQSTSLPDEQSLATLHHPPAEAEPAGILATEAACDLQPEVQLSTSMQNQPADSLFRGLDANNDDTVDTDQVHLESPISPATLPMSTEFETQTCQSSMHVEQSPEVQQSTSMQDQPAEKRACIVGPEAAMQDQPAEAEQAGVELSGTVTPHAIQPPASMPVEQSTSLPAQQSLATLRHPPAEAEPAGILATEAACDLQPEARLSTSMQDQAAEEGACIMGATAARGSQPEVQPSTSLDSHAGAESTDTLGVVTAPDMQSEIQPSALMQDRPVAAEGACVLGTTVAQELQPELQTATTVQHDPLERTRSEERRQAGFEPNTAASPEHDLQSEIQPSASMRDRPAGAEGAGMVGSTAAQDLQPERQLSTTVQHIPIGPEQPTQLPPVTPLVFNNPIFSDEPLRNELEKIIHWSTLLDKGHDDKRSQLQAERNQEIEKINRKYDSLLQQEDSAHRLKRTQLNGIYQKVYVSKSLAENFRCQFTPSVASHGRSTGHVMDQLPESSSSAARGHVMDQLPESSSSSAARGPASPPVIPSSAIRAPVHSSAGSYVRPSLVASRTVQSQSAMPGNLSGATSPPFVPAPSLHASHGPAGPQLRPVQPQSVPPSILYRTMPPGIPTPRPQGSYRPAGAAAAQQLRAPSPHLQHLRMRPPYVTPTDQQQQQQLPAILGVPAGGQFVTDSLRPAFPQPGAVLASMTPAAGSAHQPVPPSAPGSSSATPTYFVPPGRHTDPVWTPNPALTVAQLQQQASYLNMALGGGSSTSAGPAAPGSQQHAGGAQLPAVLNHPGLEPSPPPNSNRYMPARFGVEPDSSSGGTSNAAGPSAEVVCLSDDEA
uniref:CHD3-type chromatin-remodeling factor PICKLE n=1 Tax=Aegilops tauschii TaxID=37682 RepID=R7W1Z9_AEGTA